jgi:hypothetical protein
MILKCTLKRIGNEGAEWIPIIYFRGESREVVDTVVNIWVSQTAGLFVFILFI